MLYNVATSGLTHLTFIYQSEASIGPKVRWQQRPSSTDNGGYYHGRKLGKAPMQFTWCLQRSVDTCYGVSVSRHKSTLCG